MTTTDTRVQVSRTVNAPAEALFDVLSNPNRHPELDCSGFVRGIVRGSRITATGQQFRMDMAGDHMGGEYQTDNVVSAYEANKMIGWRTAPAGQEPPGWEWLWELHSTGSGTTDVTLTYDWSNVTDQDMLQQIGFPLVEQSQLEDSLNRLAQAVGA